jgi:hypothetical protein
MKRGTSFCFWKKRWNASARCFRVFCKKVESTSLTLAFLGQGTGAGGIGQPFPRFLIHIVPFTKKMMEHKTATADGFVDQRGLCFVGRRR